MAALAQIVRAAAARRRASRRPRPALRRRAGAPGTRPQPAWLPLKRLTLLVVEDHADSREMIRRLLVSLGARVLLAEHGRMALAVLEDEHPDLILLDLLMPVMDGFAFIQHKRRDPRWGRIPVIAVTALGGHRDLLRTWEEGFDAHLTKPIGDGELLAVVQRVMGGRRRSPTRKPLGSAEA
jgi:two-component system, sensor histidine kinase